MSLSQMSCQQVFNMIFDKKLTAQRQQNSIIEIMFTIMKLKLVIKFTMIMIV